MIKAESFVQPATEPRNKPMLGSLSLNQAAAALVALVSGADRMPTMGQLRCIVRRSLRARRNAARGGRRHG
jgi:hypothetical protein